MRLIGVGHASVGWRGHRLSTPAGAASGRSRRGARLANSRISTQAEDEAADVREVGDASAAADRARPGRPRRSTSCSRNQKPSSSDGGHLDDRDEEDDEHEREHARARIEQQVAAEHRGDRARGAERRRGRVGADEHLRGERDEAAEQVEGEIAQRARMASSTFGPKIARNSMLPKMCRKLPCRNIEREHGLPRRRLRRRRCRATPGMPWQATAPHRCLRRWRR